MVLVVFILSLAAVVAIAARTYWQAWGSTDPLPKRTKALFWTSGVFGLAHFIGVCFFMNESNKNLAAAFIVVYLLASFVFIFAAFMTLGLIFQGKLKISRAEIVSTSLILSAIGSAAITLCVELSIRGWMGS